MNVAPKAKAMAQVRANPVMREMMVQMLMSAAELPTFGGAACFGNRFDMREARHLLERGGRELLYPLNRTRL